MSIFEMPIGELCDRAIVVMQNGSRHLVGRLRKQRRVGNKAIIVYSIGRIAIDGSKILSFDETAASGAYNQYITNEKVNYESRIWAKFNPLLEEVRL
ncbi:MAG: hypothetical protein WC548_02585 [Candidatus Pacearchaeota archaeon]